jgi:GH43 family beta-xylosidase
MLKLLIFALFLTFKVGILDAFLTDNAAAASSHFKNPILPHGPDPWVLKHGEHYYLTHTSGPKIILYKTTSISEVKKVKPVTIWTPPDSGMHSQQIWAPEIHFIDGKFYVYFAADDGNNNNHRIYCIENADADPTHGKWTFKGKVADPKNDHWAIDVSTFEFKNQRYMIWSGWEGNVNVAQNIYIAKMSNPWTLEGERVMISEPHHTWEVVGAPPKVNEGPEGIVSPSGKLFITYSASGCWTDGYSLGLLSLKDGGNPMVAKDWTKGGDAVFHGYAPSQAFGPGHNGFFKSPDGKEDWIIYHANPKAGQGCGDFRSPRIQRFTWAADGKPSFGTPAPIGVSLKKPSGEQ